MTNHELVQIEAGEDVNAVRDRLSFLRGKRVLLVWPEEGTALTRKLDLVLIQREAMRRAIRLAIVTHDSTVIQNARELNISTFETIGASERGRWKRGRSKVFTNRHQRPKDNPDPEDLMPVASRVRINAPSLSAVQSVLLRLAVLAALVGVVAAVAYVVVPGATVRLTPARQIVEASVPVTVNTDPDFTQVDVDNAIIPAIRLTTTLEDTATIPTTGTADLGAERARGRVLFINQTETPIDIPAGTIVRTGAGEPVAFRTTEAISLAAGVGQQAEVAIEATNNAAGTVGNVAENTINVVEGPLENSVTVRNLAPTTGGQSRVESAISEFDYTIARSAVVQQLQERALNGLSEQISDDQFIIEQTLAITREVELTYSHEIGAITPTLSVTMRADVEAIVVDEQLAQSIVLARMAQQIPRGRAIQPETIRYERQNINTTDGVTFTMVGSGLVAGRVDIGQLQQELAGRSVESALEYLTSRVDLSDDTTAEITLTPDWFNRMPVLPIRINIVIQTP